MKNRKIVQSLAALAMCLLLGGCMGFIDTISRPNPSGAPYQAQQRVCSGCGGSGRGSDYLTRQNLPQAPGYSSGSCPRCGGAGYVQY
jgi:hypothetical protein